MARAAVDALDLHATVEVVVGDFADTLPEVLHRHPAIDLAFIDGFHDGDATVDFYERFLPAMTTTGVMVFDDIDWSTGMRSAWSRITADTRSALVIDLRSVGLVALGAQHLRESGRL